MGWDFLEKEEEEEEEHEEEHEEEKEHEEEEEDEEEEQTEEREYTAQASPGGFVPGWLPHSPFPFLGSHPITQSLLIYLEKS